MMFMGQFQTCYSKLEENDYGNDTFYIRILLYHVLIVNKFNNKVVLTFTSLQTTNHYIRVCSSQTPLMCMFATFRYSLHQGLIYMK